MRELDRMQRDVAALSALANKVGQDNTMAAYLEEKIDATMNLSGAETADHDQLLKTESRLAV